MHVTWVKGLLFCFKRLGWFWIFPVTFGNIGNVLWVRPTVKITWVEDAGKGCSFEGAMGGRSAPACAIAACVKLAYIGVYVFQ